jgi:L-alanine-DL-glutamate epimerase-like enolase superfamily enzyme
LAVKITDVRLHEVTGTLPHEEEVFWEERLIQPIDIYVEHRDEPRLPHTETSPRGLPLTHIFVEVVSDDGLVGIGGPVTADVGLIIHRQFRRWLIGEDPRATGRLWDIMYRSAVHGRKGEAMFAISAIDCALWDIKGKALGEPVYRLLGGPTRTEIPAYASALGYSLEPEKVHARAKQIAADGFIGTKWFPRWGPMHGKDGVRKNIELAEILRDAVGPDKDFMIDAWMSWDVPFTLEVARKIVHLEPHWIEEPVLPDKIAQYAEIRSKSPVKISGGEHEYTRWGIKQLCDAGAVDLLQPDIYWAGGITELHHICILASAYDLPVIPHGHSTPASAHLIAAHPSVTTPWLEYLIKWNDVLQHFWKEPVKPVNGIIHVPDRPGLGTELDESKFETSRYLDFEGFAARTHS